METTQKEIQVPYEPTAEDMEQIKKAEEEIFKAEMEQMEKDNAILVEIENPSIARILCTNRGGVR